MTDSTAPFVSYQVIDETENPYEPPKSELKAEPGVPEVDADRLRDQLIREQSFFRVFIVSFCGSIAGVVVLALFLITPGIFFLAFALPGLTTGLALRQFGKALDVRYRVFGGVIALLAYWLAIEVMNPSSSMVAFMLSLTNGVVAGAVSRRSLSSDEESAVYMRRMGMED